MRRNQRKLDKYVAGHYYRKKFRRFHKCIYCGEPETERDHVLPLSVAACMDLAKPDVRNRVAGGLWKVPSCRECNQVSLDKVFISILEKRKWIQSELRKKHWDYLSLPKWTECEIVELDERLRSFVIASQNMKELIKLRVGWPNMQNRR